MAKRTSKNTDRQSTSVSKQASSKRASESRPAIRPFWSGTISFGLVSVPVDLYPAKRTSRASLRMLTPHGKPIERRYWCPEHETDVHPEHILRGYEYEPGEYIIVRDEELDAASPQKSREIDLRQFIDLKDIHPVYFERPYFLLPAGDTVKAYILLTEAMEQSGKVGIATFVMRNKEYLIAILSEKGLLRAETLRFADELRKPHDLDLPSFVDADDDLVKQFAKSIQKEKTDELPRSRMQDEYSRRLRELAEKKRKNDQDSVVIQTDGTAQSDATGELDEASAESRDDDGSIDLLQVIKQRMESFGKGGAAKGGAAKKRERNGDDKQQTKQQLYEQAKNQNIAGRSQMTKDELIRALREQSR